MKNLLIALALLPLFVKGQDYEPFINTGNRWISRVHSSYNGDQKKSISQERLFFYDGDTIIANTFYHRIKYSCGTEKLITYDQNEQIIEENWVPCDTQLFALIREDTLARKVFIHESSVQFLDTCNQLLSDIKLEDPLAGENERLLMDFNILRPEYHYADSVALNGWFWSRLDTLVDWTAPFNLDTTKIDYRKISGRGESENLEEINTKVHLGVSGLIKGSGNGYYHSVFFPIDGCFHRDEGWSVLTQLVCYSDGNIRKNGLQSYKDELNKPCELRKPNSITERGSFKQKPFLRNPVEDNTLHFYQPMYGELVVQDARGAVVVQQKLTGKTEVPLGETGSGIYLVQIHTASGSFLFDRVLVK